MRPKNTTPIYIDTARAHLIVSSVSLEFSVPEKSILSDQKGTSEVSYSRQIAMYLMHCIFGITKSRIGEVFGRHFSTVSHACKVIEEQRDDPVLDDKLINLENRLRYITANQTPLNKSNEAA